VYSEGKTIHQNPTQTRKPPLEIPHNSSILNINMSADTEFEEKSTRFLKVYSNLPLEVRKEIIYITGDEEPITWNVAFLEVQAKTDLAVDILEELVELEII
jgi:hypothetical protein